ncbi:MAG: hypothetical protein OHK0029_25010 [Armatimonadaceae bacterium]
MKNRFWLGIVAPVSALLLFGMAPANAQSARDREEKAQSKPRREDRRDGGTVSASTVIIRETNNIVVVPSGSGPVVVGGGGRYPGRIINGRFRDVAPRIAFVSDRGGSPDIYIMWDNGSGLERLTVRDEACWQVGFSPVRGRIAYLSAPTIGGAGVIRMMNADGARPRQIVPEGLGQVTDIAWGPDDDWLACVSEKDGNPEIYIVRADGRQARRMTNHLAADTAPEFAPDGQSLVFISVRDGNPALYELSLNTVSDLKRLTPTEMPAVSDPAYSPRGNQIVFSAGTVTEKNLYLLNRETGEITQLTEKSGKNINPVFSPDGYRIAFSSNRGGNFAIYTMDLKGNDVRQITFGTSNDFHPSWW